MPGLQVEPREEDHVDHRLHYLISAHPLWIARLEEGKGDAVEEEYGKLKQLQLGDVPLPPKVGRHLRAQRGQSVVGVHDHVNGRVDDHKRNENVRRTVGPEVQPGKGGHRGVVVDVQPGDLGVLLPQHEEDRVEEVNKLERVKRWTMGRTSASKSVSVGVTIG
ncbi:hypothetical protein TYRP_005348 [Tyrophagus putrescentiae]|nr:hypothetical protein TYRP_005348 [Tyrophagus putrescentiae]